MYRCISNAQRLHVFLHLHPTATNLTGHPRTRLKESFEYRHDAESAVRAVEHFGYFDICTTTAVGHNPSKQFTQMMELTIAGQEP